MPDKTVTTPQLNFFERTALNAIGLFQAIIGTLFIIFCILAAGHWAHDEIWPPHKVTRDEAIKMCEARCDEFMKIHTLMVCYCGSNDIDTGEYTDSFSMMGDSR